MPDTNDMKYLMMTPDQCHDEKYSSRIRSFARSLKELAQSSPIEKEGGGAYVTLADFRNHPKPLIRSHADCLLAELAAQERPEEHPQASSHT